MTVDSNNYEEVMFALLDYVNSKGYEIILQKKRRHYQRNIYMENRLYGATNVKERREALGMSRKRLGREMGISDVIVMRMENPELRHTKETMMKFANYFGVSIEDLLVDTENPKK